ncbi:hypothetical protein K3148_07565 [Qipengyuania aurantiaca]|uniref:Cytochrome c domain-containing protein n=1 Tax=Qipengyuania aurantiaca TaxID=2867233 RepID=A0ABX8ZI95_9SPHN|nr:hypothetical protein [Qipengyuania aurantiaca]QZD88725.1 hypothetical protein K3148_07565 [Qipengyuania aurantiaca]
MRYAVCVILVSLMLAGCQSSESVRLANDQNKAPDFVVAVCGECHAVTANAVSLRSDAPGFADIANSPGLTRESLETFLSDAHNYPMQMDVDLDEGDIKVIADHIMTLQSKDYIRPPS